MIKVAMPKPSRSISARWRSEKRRSVPIIPMSRRLNNLAALYGSKVATTPSPPDRPPRLSGAWSSIPPSQSDGLHKLADLIDGQRSFNDSYKVLQASSSSAAAEAVKKLAQRFAAGFG